MTQLGTTETSITSARNRYVQAVQDYNVTVRSFPNNLTAMILGPTMRTREVRPLWVGLTVGLLVVGAATYLFTYLMIEDILALLK